MGGGKGYARIWMIPWNIFSPVLNTVWFLINHRLINFNTVASFLFIGAVARINHVRTVDAHCDTYDYSSYLRLLNRLSWYIFFVLFLTLVAFNFIVNDSRKRPIWNVMMWTSLFAGQGVILCLYSQEWYARQHCPLKNVSYSPAAVEKWHVCPRLWGLESNFKGKDISGDCDELMLSREKHLILLLMFLKFFLLLFFTLNSPTWCPPHFLKNFLLFYCFFFSSL